MHHFVEQKYLFLKFFFVNIQLTTILTLIRYFIDCLIDIIFMHHLLNNFNNFEKERICFSSSI